MGNLRAVLSVSLLSAAAACGGGGSEKPDAPIVIPDAPADAAPDTPSLPDAPSYDFSCLNNSAPTNIASTVTVSGTAQEITINGTTPSIGPNVGVSVKACKANCTGGNNLGTTTSGAQGAYTTMALTTGGVALDGYLDTTKTGDRRTLVFPPSPLAQNQANVPILMFSTNAFTLANTFFFSPAHSDTNGVLGVVATDCMNTPITEAVTLTLKQGGSVVTTAQMYDLGALGGAQAAGTYLFTNVPPGDTEVGATFQGMTFRAHVITSVAGATTTTGVRPGY